MEKNWSRTFRYWVLTLLTIIFGILIWLGRELIAPLIIASLLAYVLNPIVDFLSQRTKLSRSLVVTIAFVIGITTIFGIPALLLPTLLAEFQGLIFDLQSMLSRAQEALSTPVIISPWEFHLDQLLPELPSLFSNSLTVLTENAFHLLEAITTNTIWVLVILVTTYYLLKDWSKLRDLLLSFAPEPVKSDINRLYYEIKQVWRGYLRGNLGLMTIVGVVFTLAWVAIGLPGALILGITTGILTIIPDLGPAIAAALAVIVALFEGSTYLPISNFWFALLVLGIYFGLINIKNIWLRPRIFGRSVHLHDGVVFIAIMAAVVLQGILGALIVVPVLGSSVVIGRYLYRRLQGIPPWPEMPESEMETTNSS